MPAPLAVAAELSSLARLFPSFMGVSLAAFLGHVFAVWAPSFALALSFLRAFHGDRYLFRPM